MYFFRKDNNTKIHWNCMKFAFTFSSCLSWYYFKDYLPIVLVSKLSIIYSIIYSSRHWAKAIINICVAGAYAHAHKNYDSILHFGDKIEWGSQAFRSEWSAFCSFPLGRERYYVWITHGQRPNWPHNITMDVMEAREGWTKRARLVLPSSWMCLVHPEGKMASTVIKLRTILFIWLYYIDLYLYKK